MEQVRYDEVGGRARGTGITQQATAPALSAGAARFGEAIARATATQRHVWVANMTHLMSDLTARKLTGGQPDEVFFDIETLAGTTFGCYVCEQDLTPELIGGRCPGDPSGRVLR